MRILFSVTILMLGMLVVAGAQTYEQPVLVTSAGQSADVTMVSMMCKRLKLEATVEAKATAENLKGIKTLILVPGFSSKGLGAAGISKEEEMDRVKAIIAEAKKQKVGILLMHIGGVPRRGTQSDPFNTLAAEASSKYIVVRQGDEDGFFTNLAKEKKVPIELVDKIADTMKPLGAAFGK